MRKLSFPGNRNTMEWGVKRESYAWQKGNIPFSRPDHAQNGSHPLLIGLVNMCHFKIDTNRRRRHGGYDEYDSLF